MWLYLLAIIALVLGLVGIFAGLGFLSVILFIVAVVAVVGGVTGAFAGQRRPGPEERGATDAGETGVAHPGQEHPTGTD